MKEIFERRSVRLYQDKKVEPEKIEKLLRVAMQVPLAVILLGNDKHLKFPELL